MLTMFLLAVGVYVYAQSLERDRWERDFDRRSSAVLHALRNSLDGYLEALYATQALLLANPATDAESFHDFAAGFLERHPGLRALGWDSRVRRADRSSFEAAARIEGAVRFRDPGARPAGGVVRAADREEHFVVRYVEPLEANRRALGFDIAADATGREVLERARDGAQPVAATSPLAFFQKAGAPGAGILVFCPVYGVWPAPASIEERRATLRGFVVGVFEIGEILRASLRGKPPEGFELSLYEGAALDASRLLLRVGEVASAGLPQPAGRRLVRSMPVDVGGQHWMLSLAGPAESELSSHSLHVWVAPIGGLLLAALLGALLLILTGRTAFVEAVVRNRTGELEREAVERARATDALRRNEELFRTLATASPIGIFHADAQGRCLYTNPRCKRCGAHVRADTRQRLPRRDPSRRPLPDPPGPTHLTEAADAPIEFRFLTPSGDVRWVEVRTSAVRSAEGHVVGYVDTVEEVTEQKRAEDALRASEERYRILAEQSSDFIARFGIDGRITYASPACRTLLGYDPEELGRPLLLRLLSSRRRRGGPRTDPRGDGGGPHGQLPRAAEGR